MLVIFKKDQQENSNTHADRRLPVHSQCLRQKITRMHAGLHLCRASLRAVFLRCGIVGLRSLNYQRVAAGFLILQKETAQPRLPARRY